VILVGKTTVINAFILTAHRFWKRSAIHFDRISGRNAAPIVNQYDSFWKYAFTHSNCEDDLSRSIPAQESNVSAVQKKKSVLITSYSYPWKCRNLPESDHTAAVLW